MRMTETIAVIGTGNVGSALGRAFAKRGHIVRFGARKPSDPKNAALTGGAATASVHAPAEAVKGAGIVVLATPWDATRAALAALGPLHGKLVIDCTNPLAPSPTGLDLALGHSTSGGEQVAAWAAGAAVFKAFNQVGYGVMENAAFPRGRPLMLVAGDHETAKPRILALVSEIGFEAVDAGPLSAARLLEPMALMWIKLALFLGQGRDFAFALLRR
jgi:8-hydroxy-5-deazaflavin:NADPH oxidoreductase